MDKSLVFGKGLGAFLGMGRGKLSFSYILDF